jgi:hypothetical protein
MLHEQHDQQAARHADGEAGDVDERIRPIFEQMAESEFEIIFEHDRLQYSVIRDQRSVNSYQWQCLFTEH